MYIIHINYVYIRKTTYNAVYTDATYTDDTQTQFKILDNFTNKDLES